MDSALSARANPQNILDMFGNYIFEFQAGGASEWLGSAYSHDVGMILKAGHSGMRASSQFARGLRDI